MTDSGENFRDFLILGAIISEFEAEVGHLLWRAAGQDRLGPVVWHDSLAQASAVLEELEETARPWLMTGRSAPPLSEDRIEELRRHFGASW